jgi:hypothetical protein
MRHSLVDVDKQKEGVRAKPYYQYGGLDQKRNIYTGK